MAITNGGPLRAPDTMVVFTPSTITVAVGETATINYSSGTAAPSASTLDTLFGGIATTEVDGGGMVGTIVISGVSTGTASIAPSTPLGNGATMSQDGFTLTVTAPVDDDKFLNKRGLTHFWENIDDIKQDKLTAGTNITIAADNTISASQPTVNDATLTIQQNGTNVQTFTANQSTDATANITVPTKTSDLVNDGADNTSTYLEADETAYRGASIPFGIVDNTSTSTVFTATVPGITELRDGVCMWLKNGTVTSASGFTINVNNLGAKPVYSNQAAATRETTLFNVNYTFFFVYDSTRVEGGCWMLDRGYNSNDNTIGYQIRTNSTLLPTTDKTRYYRILFTSADNSHWVPANTGYDNSATSIKTVNQRKINPFGRIVYMSGTTNVNAGANVGAAVVWDQNAFSLGYSFNNTGSALAMTSKEPVYIKCTPQADGSAIIDSTTPYVQDLPTTDDGKIYIYLGIAYSATNVEMVINHPVYYYKDGAIREWSNAEAGGISSVAWGDITGTLSNQTDLNNALGAKANSADLALVATSGSYSDLSNKPTIPTVNNATLTIQKNGTTVNTFTANASSDVTANITVPINVSELTNDAGYLTSVTWGDVTGKPTFATVATSGSYNDLSDKPTIPTVNDATLTITQNGTSVGTFTANASSNATIDVNAPKLTSLVGSVQTSDYHRSVVALCEVASGSGSAVNSWSSGKLVAHRNNGAYGVVEIGINIEAKRSTAYYSNVSYFSNIALLSPTANINTDLGFRPCTFKYNNVYYAGIEFYISSSSASNVYFSGVGNFDVFGLDYYSVSHGSTASSVLNSEVYNSLNYTQWNEERNQWHVGRATRDIIYNNGSGTNANFSTTSAMSNYDEVEICYRDNNQNYAFKRVPGPAGNFVLDMVHPGANSIAYWYISRYIVSGTNITVGANNMRKAIGSTSVTTTAAQDIYITRIVGIRN